MNTWQAFVETVLVCPVLPILTTSSDLYYESYGSCSVASLVLRQLLLGANSPKRFADRSSF